jgi:hypothetical protein
MSRAANAPKALRSRTCGRLYSCDAIIERLAQDFQDVAFELGQFTQKEPAVVRQRHLPGRGDLPAADQAHSGDGVMGDATRARRDGRRAVTGAAGAAVDARGLEGVGRAQRRQDGGEPPRQPRLPQPQWTEEAEMMVTAPASRVVWPPSLPRAAAAGDHAPLGSAHPTLTQADPPCRRASRCRAAVGAAGAYSAGG